MAVEKPQASYEALKAEITRLGLVRPGSLVRRYMPCGRAGCRCMADPPELHGPYYQWSHKVRGKTATRRLSRAQADRCREWIRNHRQLKRLVRRLEALSLRATDRELDEISSS
jgi:hypothetical protein